MNVIGLAATKRSVTHGSSVKGVRKDKRVPGVLYGLEENVHFSVDARELRKLIYTPHFSLIDLECEGKTTRCIIKDYQAHPVSDEIQHIDMLALKEGRKVKVEIPVRFVGVSPGVKAGGKVISKLRKVKIKTTPENLVSEFTVDISHLTLGQSVRVKDMIVGEDVEVLNPGPIPMATVEVPRALKSAASKEEEGVTVEGDDEEAAETE
jgi:large subunit ribosomal protein L25